MTTSGSDGSAVGGNSTSPTAQKKEKRIAPSKRWCFTLNNPTASERQTLGSVVPGLSTLAIIGDEIGDECGTPHLQGYIEFTKKVRPLSAIKLPRIWWVKSRGSRRENLEYCGKDCKPFLKHGLPPELKDRFQISQAAEWQREVLELVDKEPDWRKVNWYWDKMGGTGKSTLTRHLLLNRTDTVYLSKGKYADIAYIISQTDMDFKKNIIIDLPRNNGAKVSYDAIEALKNGMILSTKYEGQMALFNPLNVIVFANAPPEVENLSEDRWVIRNIDPY